MQRSKSTSLLCLFVFSTHTLVIVYNTFTMTTKMHQINYGIDPSQARMAISIGCVQTVTINLVIGNRFLFFYFFIIRGGVPWIW